MLDNIALGIIWCLIFISLLVLFSVLFVKLHIRKVTDFTRSLYQKDIDFQKTLTKTVIETQEHVLNDISQDLHDDAGQQLTYVNLQLENLKFDSPELQATLEPVSQSIRKLAASIRGISHSLNNQIAMQNDLMKAIRNEAERVSSGKLRVSHLIPSHEKRDFTPDQRIVIYRIFQETINNALKHAGAEAVSVTITQEPFLMIIADNGNGFDVGYALSNGTLGLKSMKARAEAIGFNLDIQSHPGNGTEIRVSENWGV